MGWPEFQKCCGCLSLKTGTIVIGCWISIISTIAVAVHITLLCLLIIVQIESDETAPVLVIILIGAAVFLNGIHSVVGVMIVIFRKNGKYLGKLVFYMIVLALTKLLVNIIGASTENSLEHYISAVWILLDCYFILIVRSNQLQLEGRLTNPIDVRRRRRRSLEHRGITTVGTTYHNNTYPPPPPYDEAMRYGNVYRCDFAATLSPTDEVTNEDSREVVSEQNPVILSRPLELHTVAAGSTSESGKKNFPEEPECVIYDERQLTAINGVQVERRELNISVHELQTAL